MDRSQAGETTLLRKLAKLDVGANEGVTISNSLPFIELGWRAILVEPAPAVFKKLVANRGGRDNVTCLQIACCDKSGEADLYFGLDGEDGFNPWIFRSVTTRCLQPGS